MTGQVGVQQPTTPLFDKLLEQTDDEIKVRQIKIARRTLQRKFQSAHDDADNKAMKLQVLLDKAFDYIAKKPLEACENFDVNLMVQRTAEMSQFIQHRDAISKKYAELFGEEIPSI